MSGGALVLQLVFDALLLVALAILTRRAFQHESATRQPARPNANPSRPALVAESALRARMKRLRRQAERGRLQLAD